MLAWGPARLREAQKTSHSLPASSWRTSEDPAVESCPRRLGRVPNGAWPWECRRGLGSPSQAPYAGLNLTGGSMRGRRAERQHSGLEKAATLSRTEALFRGGIRPREGKPSGP